MKKITVLLVIVIIFASILRLHKLGTIPTAMSDDEVRLAYNAYSIWNTGKDIYGKFLPLAFVVDGYAFNPIPIYLVSPFVGVFGLNEFSSRMLFALSGIASIYLVFLIANSLLKNKTIAMLSAFSLTFSAWHLQLSRFAYEGTIALFFYLLGIFLIIKTKKNNLWTIFGSCFAFLFAFYSYSGNKLILIPIIGAILWFKYKELTRRQLLIFGAFVLFIILSFAFLSKVQNASQYGTYAFFFQDNSKVAEIVELERRGSSAPEILKKLYHNKFVYWRYSSR